MIDLQDCIDKCYAEISHDCSLLVETAEQCNYKCAFYKPSGCKDWIRMMHNGRAVICPPEEYERRFKIEADTEPSEVYWRISSVLKSKK